MRRTKEIAIMHVLFLINKNKDSLTDYPIRVEDFNQTPKYRNRNQDIVIGGRISHSDIFNIVLESEKKIRVSDFYSTSSCLQYCDYSYRDAAIDIINMDREEYFELLSRKEKTLDALKEAFKDWDKYIIR